jgi:hypothetical protein
VAHFGQHIEYWLQTQLNPIADEPLDSYLGHLKDQWLNELNAMTPMIAQYFQGQEFLFYPTEAYDIFEKYWDYFPNINDHPDFTSESQVCQERMMQFSRALAGMRHKSFEPKSVAEAGKSSLRMSEDAALSRLRPVPDGPCQWEAYGSSTDTGSGASMPIFPGLVAGSGAIGTCVT